MMLGSRPDDAVRTLAKELTAWLGTAVTPKDIDQEEERIRWALKQGTSMNELRRQHRIFLRYYHAA